ncbi:MAG: hypothetical protein GC136_05770 [Alphaproteobacteria bacterium]|nr:hypothetical protein [Alphaproteobacteria bacterium]
MQLSRLAASLFGPKVICRVSGFEASIEHVQGKAIIHGVNKKPLSQDNYLEVSLRATGSNYDYPAESAPEKFRFTVMLPPYKGMGTMGNTSHIPATAKWTRFEIVEEYHDGKPKMGHMGIVMPAHHAIKVRGYYKENGRETFMSLGGRIRKSETDNPRWRYALECAPIYS